MIYRAMPAETRPLAPIAHPRLVPRDPRLIPRDPPVISRDPPVIRAHPSLVPEDEATYAIARVMTP